MASTGTKPVVAVDLDEVLGAFVEGLALFHNDKYGTALTSADFRSYHFSDVWGGTTEEATEKVVAFYESDHFRDLAPIAAAYDTLRSLTHAFKFVVVTSRQHVVATKTKAWLDRHFPSIFSDVMFGNHYGTGDGSASRSKLDMCREVDAVALIDDSVKYAMEVAPSLPLVILFGNYPWNATAAPDATMASGTGMDGDGGGRLPANVIRAVNWRHVSVLLHRIKPRVDGGGGRGGRSGRDDRAGGPARHQTAAMLAQGLHHRDATTIYTRGDGGAIPTPESTAEHVRRLFEVQETVSITGTGYDTRLVAEAADVLTTGGDAVVLAMRTGADAAPEGKPRFPRLTITLQRTPHFMETRFSLSMRGGGGAGGGKRAFLDKGKAWAGAGLGGVDKGEATTGLMSPTVLQTAAETLTEGGGVHDGAAQAPPHTGTSMATTGGSGDHGGGEV